MTIVFLTPPLTKPSEPGLSAAAAAHMLARAGVAARWVDASLGWHEYVLSPRALAKCHGKLSPDTAHAFDSVLRSPSPGGALRKEETYANRHVYTSAIRDLERALQLTAASYPGLRLGIAMIGWDGKRVESRETLRRFASDPGPFDDYVMDVLFPSLDGLCASHVAVSLTFQQQAPAAFRIARLLAEHRPSLRRWLGGPLVACWQAAGFDLAGEPFAWFHQVAAGTNEDLGVLAAEASPGLVTGFDAVPLSPRLQDVPWDSYLSPVPVVPAAVGKGCYWRRCTFCPDHQHARHSPCSVDALERWLGEVASRFPQGAMVHFTDSAVPPAFLDHIAGVIRRERLPIQWHGFVRVEECLADEAFTRHLAEGGCAMLQLGVETGSPRLLERTGKGTDPDRTRRVLRSAAGAGIRNHVYLLFALPTETDEDREMTLSLVEACGPDVLAINPALLNLPLGSPMQRHPERFGITEMFPFGPGADLALYRDFRCGASHPRSEARRWLGQRFFKHSAVRQVQRHLRSPFKANHLCFLG